MLCGGILSRHFVGHFAAACEKLDDSQRGEWGQESGGWVGVKGTLQRDFRSQAFFINQTNLGY